MSAKMPPPVPELPVTDVRAASHAYASRMGFSIDWTYEDYLAGISKDAARVFLRRRTPQEDSQGYSVLIWLNMASPADVDQLHAEWKRRRVAIVDELKTTPHNLREFTAQDLDGNRLRVFFDLGSAETKQRQPGHGVLAAWRTSNGATTYLIEHLPAAIWSMEAPGLPRRTVGMIAAHIHNSRCSWIKALGSRHGVEAPPPVDPKRVRPRELVRALSRSSQGMIALIELGIASGGRVPRAKWQNFPTDLEHFLSYFVAHEAHHRGQLCLLARQLGHRLPREVAGGVWQWTRLSRR